MSTLTLTAPIVTPTKASPAGIYVYHNREDMISLGLELAPDGTVTGALSVCSPRDQFSPRKAQFILRERLKAAKTGRGGLTFKVGRYVGSEFKNSLFIPMVKTLRDGAENYLVRQDGMWTWGNQKHLFQNLIRDLLGSISADGTSVV